MSNALGAIGPDKQADLVLIDGHPLRDIKSMRRAPGVMLGGR
jgi:imidazolonepropionase-like amidohydrolase